MTFLVLKQYFKKILITFKLMLAKINYDTYFTEHLQINYIAVHVFISVKYYFYFQEQKYRAIWYKAVTAA